MKPTTPRPSGATTSPLAGRAPVDTARSLAPAAADVSSLNVGGTVPARRMLPVGVRYWPGDCPRGMSCWWAADWA